MSRAARVAVVPAAGRGTRMRPASDAVPKELLPVGGRPAIDWVIEEAWSSGIEHIVVVTSREKAALNGYLGRRYGGRCQPEGLYPTTVRRRSDDRTFGVSLVEQPCPRGLGDAVRTGWEAARDDVVGVLLPDEVALEEASAFGSMLELHDRTAASVVSLVEVAPDEVSAYGCADVSELSSVGALRVSACVEKPDPGTAPSSLVLSGRYVLGAEVLDELRRTPPDVRGEIPLTPALDASARAGRLLGARAREGAGLADVGNWTGWLAANVRAFELKYAGNPHVQHTQAVA